MLHEAGTEHALDRAPGVVGAKRKKEGRLRIIALQCFDQPRHAFAGAAIGINVNLEGELFGHLSPLSPTPLTLRDNQRLRHRFLMA